MQYSPGHAKLRGLVLVVDLLLGLTVALQHVEGGARHVEDAARVNVHHGAEPVRGERLGRHEKIARRAIHEHVEPARRTDGRCDRRRDGGRDDRLNIIVAPEKKIPSNTNCDQE